MSFFVLLDKLFDKELKGQRKYIEDLRKQQQTFTMLHGAAPELVQPKKVW